VGRPCPQAVPRGGRVLGVQQHEGARAVGGLDLAGGSGPPTAAACWSPTTPRIGGPPKSAGSVAPGSRPPSRAPRTRAARRRGRGSSSQRCAARSRGAVREALVASVRWRAPRARRPAGATAASCRWCRPAARPRAARSRPATESNSQASLVAEVRVEQQAGATLDEGSWPAAAGSQRSAVRRSCRTRAWAARGRWRAHSTTMLALVGDADGGRVAAQVGGGSGASARARERGASYRMRSASC
jgi:hypothetical protein